MKSTVIELTANLNTRYTVLESVSVFGIFVGIFHVGSVFGIGILKYLGIFLCSMFAVLLCITQSNLRSDEVDI